MLPRSVTDQFFHSVALPEVAPETSIFTLRVAHENVFALLATISAVPPVSSSYRMIIASESKSFSSVGIGNEGIEAAPESRSEYLDYFLLSEGCWSLSLQFASRFAQSGLPKTSSLHVACRPEGREITDQACGVLDVPEISQMPFEAQPLTIRRLCGPTCVRMIAEYFGRATSWHEWQDYAWNAETASYGVWPQLIHSANHLDLHGAIVLIDSAADLRLILSNRIPIIASIRIAEGAIPDFPFGRSPGHMVVVRGLSDDEILVNDPAHSVSICRSYPVDLFMKVWSSSRPEIGHCVGLLLWPCAVS
jgi:hypothetical protein